MNIPVQHHYVPKVLQKRFSSAPGKIWAHRLGTEAFFETNPDNVFVERHLYSQGVGVGVPDATIELNLSRLEGYVSPILDRIISYARLGQAYALTSQQKSLWDLFLLMQCKRVPSVYTKGILAYEPEAQITRIRSELLEEVPDMREEIDRLTTGATGAQIIRDMKVRTVWSASAKVMEGFSRRGVAVVVVKPPKRTRFILGDTPVLRLGRGGLEGREHEIWLPVASDVLLGIGRFGKGLELFDAGTERIVHRTNTLIADQSDMIAGCSRDLLMRYQRSR